MPIFWWKQFPNCPTTLVVWIMPSIFSLPKHFQRKYSHDLKIDGQCFWKNLAKKTFNKILVFFRLNWLSYLLWLLIFLALKRCAVSSYDWQCIFTTFFRFQDHEPVKKSNVYMILESILKYYQINAMLVYKNVC